MMQRLQLPVVGSRAEAGDESCKVFESGLCRDVEIDGVVRRSNDYVLPEDRVFHRSPMILLSTDDIALGQRVEALLAECPPRQWDSSCRWHSYRRKPSVKQRDGHLRRLKGVLALEELLRLAEESECTEYSVYYCGQVRVVGSF